jgi:serine/threonine-protein kinase PknG
MTATAAQAVATPAAPAASGPTTGSGRTRSSQIVVNSARPGAALSVVQRRYGSGAVTGGGVLRYSDRADDRPCFACGALLRKTANFCPHCGASKDARLNGRYLFAGIVGGGGMGGVLGVEDMNLVDQTTGHGRLLVAKFALPNPDPDLAEQARRERQFLIAIDHPRLVKVLDLLSIGGKDWIVMELVPGEDLTSVGRELGQAISVADALRYAIQICEAFQYLHTLPTPLIYRDMKPDNVMLMPTGEIKIVDLGGAKLLDRAAAKDEIAIGTPGYYAPEAPHGLTDERSDLYSLGRTLLALVIGADWRAEDEPPGVPARERFPVLRRYRPLYDLLGHACAEKPEERYQSAAELADDLRTVLHAIAGAAAGVVTRPRFGSTSLDGGALATPVALAPEEDPVTAALRGGDLLLQVGRPEQALRAYEAAVQQFPGSVDAHCRMAIGRAATGNFSAATNAILKASALAPASWKPRWAAAQVFAHQGEWDHAAQQLRLVVRAVPGEAAPLLALAEVLQRTGNLDEAIETYELLLEGDPQNGEALYQLGLACRQGGDLARAIASLSAVPPTAGRYTVSRIELVQTAVQQGNPDVLADQAAQVASLLHRDAGDLRDVQAAWARYCYAAAALARTGKLPSGVVKLADGERSGGQLVRLGDEALREALRKAPEGTPERAALVALWQERPWTVV